MKSMLNVCLSLGALVTTAVAQSEYQFDFTGKSNPGWTAVTATNLYRSETGYGFELGADFIPAKAAASEHPFLFSVKLPAGNYQVTVGLNGLDGHSSTTIKSEQRRLMLEQVTDGGEQTFIVNVRTPHISDTQKVHLKKREVETETVDWDNKLTLEFNGTRPTLRTLKISPVTVPTVFLAGDSTVCDQPAEPWNSWGQMLPRFFQPKVAVANYAESGETIKSSLGANRFEKIFSLMQPGDYLLLQFGHNDMKDKATNALAVYKANLKAVVARAQKLGGHPVLVTSMERKNGVDQPTLAGYPDTVRAVAAEDKVPLVDLNRLSVTLYRALGTNLDLAFQDGTHHNNYGSYELAKCVVTGLQQANVPLAQNIVAGFAFDPAHPDDPQTFKMAASPTFNTTKPLGN